MKLYRCNNGNCATRDFASDQPVCPDCGADNRKPGHGALVLELAIIHFDPPGPFPGHGTGQRACDQVFVGRGRSSGEHKAVSCPACRASQVFRDTYAGEGGEEVNVPAADAVWEADPRPLRVVRT